jgi:hypothetical protein
MRIFLACFASSVSGIFTSLVFLCGLTVIFAIISTSLFRNDVPQQFFGKFSTSLFTMWQVGMGDQWSIIAREVMESPNWSQVPGIGWFFALYAFLISVLMNNLIVIVFLRNFLACTTENGLRKAHESYNKHLFQTGQRKASSPLDPLLEEMSKFADQKELDTMIEDLFMLMALGREVGFDEMHAGLFKLSIVINREHWENLISEVIPHTNGALNLQTFSKMIRQQLRLFPTNQLLNKVMFEEHREHMRPRGTIHETDVNIQVLLPV